MALERDHAGPHEAVLQLGDSARLLLQQSLRVLRQVLEKRLLLDAPARATIIVPAGGLGQGAEENCWIEELTVQLSSGSNSLRWPPSSS